MCVCVCVCVCVSVCARARVRVYPDILRSARETTLATQSVYRTRRGEEEEGSVERAQKVEIKNQKFQAVGKACLSIIVSYSRL